MTTTTLEDSVKLAHVYLNFPGTTDEALRHYEGVFGAKVTQRMTFGEAGFMKDVPEAAKGKVMHAQLPLTDQVVLMASDAIPGFGPPVQYGNSFHVSVVGHDRAEADRVFAGLSAGGKVTMPIANAPWGAYFGMCVDRFGVNWMVSLDHAV